MAALVSQDQALRQLRLVEAALSADQLADVMDKAEQASFIVVDYLKAPFIDGPLAINPYRKAKAGAPPDRRAPPGPPPRPGLRWGWWGDSWGWGWGWSEDDPDATPPLPPLYPVPAWMPSPPPAPWTQTTCPSLVKAAILIVLTSLYDGRTPDDSLLSPSVVGILARFRDPACA
ncbi:MAG TPA: hypothetical protein VGG68_00675 [Caulobacteraceae bacterium]|jgi:hypothetical protein